MYFITNMNSRYDPQIIARIPETHVNEIDKMIENKIIKSRSEFIRRAIYHELIREDRIPGDLDENIEIKTMIQKIIGMNRYIQIKKFTQDPFLEFINGKMNIQQHIHKSIDFWNQHCSDVITEEFTPYKIIVDQFGYESLLAILIFRQFKHILGFTNIEGKQINNSFYDQNYFVKYFTPEMITKVTGKFVSTGILKRKDGSYIITPKGENFNQNEIAAMFKS